MNYVQSFIQTLIPYCLISKSSYYILWTFDLHKSRNDDFILFTLPLWFQSGFWGLKQIYWNIWIQLLINQPNLGPENAVPLYKLSPTVTTTELCHQNPI